MQKIILASQSPRRKKLLEWAEIDFQILVRHTDETYPAHLAVEEIPVYISEQKAKTVIEHIANTRSLNYNVTPVVIAADTVVVLEKEIIGKPESRDEAIETLHKLSGKTHKVITGVYMAHGEKEYRFHDTTEVSFHELSTEQIEHYVDVYKPYDKAGAYAIQEWIGVVGIKSINGDFYNVMGLPVSKVVKLLHEIVQ